MKKYISIAGVLLLAFALVLSGCEDATESTSPSGDAFDNYGWAGSSWSDKLVPESTITFGDNTVTVKGIYWSFLSGRDFVSKPVEVAYAAYPGAPVPAAGRPSYASGFGAVTPPSPVLTNGDPGFDVYVLQLKEYNDYQAYTAYATAKLAYDNYQGYLVSLAEYENQVAYYVNWEGMYPYTLAKDTNRIQVWTNSEKNIGFELYYLKEKLEVQIRIHKPFEERSILGDIHTFFVE
jgi:hypothetical protein